MMNGSIGSVALFFILTIVNHQTYLDYKMYTGAGKTALVQALSTGHSSKSLMRQPTTKSADLDVLSFSTTIVSGGEKVKIQVKVTDTVRPCGDVDVQCIQRDRPK